MKIAILGATGFVGQAAARELAADDAVRDLLLVDYDIRAAKTLAKSLSPKCRWSMADVGRAVQLERVLDGIDAAASAVGPCAEYETGVLAACAASKTPAASIGDGPVRDADRRALDEAFRKAGAAAVSGCGLLPGWTELLSDRLPRASGGADRPPDEASRFLFCSPDRFGGYAFFRRLARASGPSAPSPAGSPPGAYIEESAGRLLGLPPGKAAALHRRIAGGLGVFGAAGRELAAAFLFWLRGRMPTGPGTPAAAAGVALPLDGGYAVAAVDDPGGRLAGVTLARAAVLLASGAGGKRGLLALPELVGREEADRIAASCGSVIRTGTPAEAARSVR